MNAYIRDMGERNLLITEIVDDRDCLFDIYKGKLGARDVFVKRLKNAYGKDQLYKEALRKEYEVFSRLRHPSLPEYICYDEDIIVTGFIFGSSLVELMITPEETLIHDVWLLNRMLHQILDAIGHLHRHNIAHLAVTVQNIIYVRGHSNFILSNFNLPLGDPEEYLKRATQDFGMTRTNRNIDYMELGLVMELLSKATVAVEPFRIFRLLCDKPDIDGADLKNALSVKDMTEWIISGHSPATYTEIPSFIQETDSFIIKDNVHYRLDKTNMTAEAIGFADNPDTQENLVISHEVSSGSKRYRVTAISSNAFSQLGSLKKIRLPDTLIKIGAASFRKCTGLKEIFIPSSVREIDLAAFVGCTGLQKISLDGNRTIRIAGNAFVGCDFQQLTIEHRK